MKHIVIFGGTTEGRELAASLQYADGVAVHMCVATSYGEEVLSPYANMTIHTGRMTMTEMCGFFRAYEAELVIDATHPYAVEVTDNIKNACVSSGVQYMRICRDISDAAEAALGAGYVSGKSEAAVVTDCGRRQVVSVRDMAAAVKYLSQTAGNVLITSGSKELSAFTALEAYQSRCYARILSSPGVVAACHALGFTGAHLCCMQGPFTEEFNYAQMQMLDIRYVVTKASGQKGGFWEKYQAAKRAGAVLIVIEPPVEIEQDKEVAYTLQSAKIWLWEQFHIKTQAQDGVRRQIFVAGIGMGTPEGMTYEVRQAIAAADVLIGAGRMLESCKALLDQTVCGAAHGQDGTVSGGGVCSHEVICINAYKPSDIMSAIDKTPENVKITVVFSGDIGFYSGAAKLLGLLKDTQDSVTCLGGMSSPVYFLDKLGIAWEDVHFLSAHGQQLRLISQVRSHKKLCLLLGKKNEPAACCQLLCDYGLGDVKVAVGERLSYDNEQISTGRAADFVRLESSTLTVLYIENPAALPWQGYGISDECFIRGKVPMTKCEIRTLVLNKLRLQSDSIVYDVGAGTGSVSVEAGLRCIDGQVYAIEQHEAAAALIMENLKQFQLDNVQIIQGKAPACLEELPAPTHVFIGGGSGLIEEITGVLCRKNPLLRLAVTAVSLETIAEVMSLVKRGILTGADIVQISAATAKKAGSHHLMTAANPVYIVTAGLGGGCNE